jgi:peptidoglycan/xylan/chitin deacetylase (PgdA/CDA1 family)
VIITFDDGYRDNYSEAFQILKAHGASATFFVTTGFVDHPRLSWWDEIAWMVRNSRRHSVSAGRWLQSAVVFDEPQRERAIHALLTSYKSLPGERTEHFLEFLAEASGSGRYHGDERSAETRNH